MPVRDYNGDTFVAFVDVSGFKALMNQKNRAQLALHNFYQIGYDVLRDARYAHHSVEGFFVSDCGILFVRKTGEIDQLQQLTAMLEVIEKISRRMLEHDLMLTASIAYGKFSYHQRLEFEGIEKNPIYGFAYLDAYLDSEAGSPKIQPGQCRILNKNIDKETWEEISNSREMCLDRVLKESRDGSHLYFYWMVQNSAQIDGFREYYHDAYNLKYKGMLDALKKYPVNV